MAEDWKALKDDVATVIKPNSIGAITGDVLQSTLLNIINRIGKRTFAGIAGPSTVPGIPEGPVFYIASELGTYSGFNSYLHTGPDALIFMNEGGEWKIYRTGLVSTTGLRTINGQSLLGIDNILTTYITDFSVADIENIASKNITFKSLALINAIRAKAVILIPQFLDSDNIAGGYSIANGICYDDMLYLTFIDNVGNIYSISLEYILTDITNTITPRNVVTTNLINMQRTINQLTTRIEALENA